MIDAATEIVQIETEFAEHINNIEPGETYESVVKYASQLLTSERASLVLMVNVISLQ